MLTTTYISSANVKNPQKTIFCFLLTWSLFSLASSTWIAFSQFQHTSSPGLLQPPCVCVGIIRKPAVIDEPETQLSDLCTLLISMLHMHTYTCYMCELPKCISDLRMCPTTAASTHEKAMEINCPYFSLCVLHHSLLLCRSQGNANAE